MIKRIHALQNLPDPVPARIAGTTAAVLAAASIFVLQLLLAPPYGWSVAKEVPRTLGIDGLVDAFNTGWSRLPYLSTVGSVAAWTMDVFTGPAQELADRGVLIQLLVLVATSIPGAWWIGRDVFRTTLKMQPPVRGAVTVVGSEPRYGAAGAAILDEAWGERRLVEGKGIMFAPGIVMPRDVETEHVAVMGSTGSGKSTIIEGLARQGIRRGDRAVMIDVKGGLGRRFAVTNVAELSLASANGVIWRIGRDILTRQDATEFAAALIPASRDPIWSDGARLYVTGLIVALQQRYKTAWGWRHIRKQLALSFGEQEQLIRKSMPDVAHLLQMKDGDPTATVMSILVTVVASVGSLAWTLAEREKTGGRYFSLRSWAAGKSKIQVVVLRLEYDRESQSAALLKLALRCVQSTLLGAEVEDGKDNAIWLGLDELPRFCDAETVERLVALGRSRGVRIVAALQAPAQLRREIGADAAAALLANFGIQIVSRMAPGPSRKEVVEDWFGSRTVTWQDPAKKDGPGAVQTRDMAVLTENELTGLLGKFYRPSGRRFIRAAVTGFSHVPVLDWPVGWADRL